MSIRFACQNRCYIGLAIVLITFVLILSYKSIRISTPSDLNTSLTDGIPQMRRPALDTSRMMKSITSDGQFFILNNEAPLICAYLDIVRDTVCGLTLQTQEKSVVPAIEKKVVPFNLALRIKGLDWPLIGITMIGRSRLTNIEWALRFVIENNVPGDFIECGVWRGGGSIFARAVLRAFNIKDRHVWLADSFEGLPKPRTKNDHDEWSKQEYLKVSVFVQPMPNERNQH